MSSQIKNVSSSNSNNVQKTIPDKKEFHIFWTSFFFVLGFSTIFSILGVLIQTILQNSGTSIQLWLGRLGGIIIILFGLFLLNLINLPWLEQEHRFQPKKKYTSRYLTAFIFGAAFAAGWTPCVGPILGAIIALATIQPGSAGILLFAYSIGLGIPFLLIGLFTNQARTGIHSIAKKVKWIQPIFGILLIILGILIFVGQLSKLANFQILTMFLSTIAPTITGSNITSISMINLGIAILAGIVSFLSPCVLPLIPGFMAYLGATSIKK